MPNFFRPPVFDDASQTQTARQLHIILWTLIIAFTTGASIMLVIAPENFRRWLLLISVIDGTSWLLLVLNRRGYIRLASSVLGLTVWVVITAFALTAGGTRSPAAMTGYLILVIIVGTLSGWRAGLLTAVLCGFTNGGLAYLEMTDRLPPTQANHTPITLGLTSTLFIIVGVGLQYLTVTTFRTFLQQAQTELTERRQAETALERERNLLRVVIDNLPDYIYLKDLHHRNLVSNLANARALGVATPAEVVGKTLADFYPPEEAARYNRLDDEVVKAGEPVHKETTFVDLTTGQQRWAWMTRIPFRNRQGQLAGIVGITRDITELKQIQVELSEQSAEMTLLYRAAERLARGDIRDLQAVAQQVTDIVVEEFGCQHCGLSLIQGEVLQTFARSGAGQNQPFPALPLNDGGLTVWVTRSGEALYVPDVKHDPRYLMAATTTRSEFVAPLRTPAGVLGVLNLEHPDVDAFPERTRRALTAFAERAALALENAQLYQAAQIELAERHRAEVALRESEALYRRAIEAAEAVPYYLDHATATYRFIGAGIEHLTGYAPVEINLRVWRSLVEESYRLGAAAQFSREEANRLAHAGQLTSWSTDNRIHTRGGQTRWVNNSSVEVLGPTGASIGAIGIFQDVTERKQAEESIRQYADVVTNMQVGLYIIEAETETADRLRIIAANPAALRFSGMSEAEVVGTLLIESFPNLRAKGLAQKYAEVIQTGRPQELGDEYFDATGQLETAYAIKAFPLPHRRVGVAFEDVTRRRQAEAALNRLNTELEQRVQARTEELMAANAALAQAARLKDEFLASTSHELRTPLTGILAFAQTLQKPRVYGELNEKQLRAVRTIEDSGKHLLELINDILDLSKIESGKFELALDFVAAEDACQGALRLVRQLAASKRQTLSYTLQPTDLRLTADARRLKQMLVNLLSNAVKFTPEGGALGLEVTGDPLAQVVRFVVWDHGIGITPENLGRLFQSFVQLDARLAREYSGTGLGLALVRRMSELHGGSVGVESELGRGSRFTISLPWPTLTEDRPRLQPPTAFVLPPPAARPRRALTVEDSAIAAEQLTHLLTEMGIANVVHTQADGALEKAVTAQPGVILLDLFLPDESGWNVLTRLRLDPRTRDIPIIIVSVLDERARAAQLGASGYLVKPVARADLQALLEQVWQMPTAASATTAAPVLVATAAPVRPRLLLAEDNAINVQVLTDYLEAQGYAVTAAADGRVALDKARAAYPQLIIMDIQMPNMDGLEATRLIRQEPALAKIPIIALTALAMPGDRERCLAAGANDYLTKPVNLDLLTEKIQTLLKS